MFWGIVAYSAVEEDAKLKMSYSPLYHNLDSETQKALLAECRARYPQTELKGVEGFSHATLHQEFIDPRDCTACQAAYEEALRIAEENYRARKLRDAASPPAHDTVPSAEVVPEAYEPPGLQRRLAATRMAEPSK